MHVSLDVADTVELGEIFAFTQRLAARATQTGSTRRSTNSWGPPTSSAPQAPSMSCET